MNATALQGFTTPKFLLEPIGFWKWRVEEPISYVLSDGRSIYVPRGFITNFASTPRFVWSLWPPWRWDYGPAAIVHDMGYYMHYALRDFTFTKDEIDKLYYTIMLERNTPKATANIHYLAVQKFGDKAWNGQK